MRPANSKTTISKAPSVSVILNVDADHLEYFGSLDNIIRSFHRFSELTTKTLLVNGNDANTMRAVEGIEGKTIIRFGTDSRLRLVRSQHCARGPVWTVRSLP